MTDEPTPQLLSSIPPDSPAHRQLVATVKRLREAATSEEDRQMFDDILEGRRSARDILSSPMVANLATRGFQRYQAARAELSDEQREEADQRAANQADSFFEPDGRP